MNYDEFKKKYSGILTDRRGRVNANIPRSKIYEALKLDCLNATKDFDKSISISDRLGCIIHDIHEWPECESCGKPVKLGAGFKFTPFCSFKCSRKPGSSTFTKAQQTCINRYGTKSNLCTEEALEKKRHDGGIGAQNKETLTKIKKTNLKKYGTENVFAVDSVKEKIKETHDKKYGGNFHTMRLGEKVRLLEDKKYCEDLAANHCMSSIAEIIGVASNTIYKYFEKHEITTFNRQRSNQETEMFEFIASLGVKSIEQGNRSKIKPYEIDVFIPDFNLGIELNGLYWHSENAGCKPSYHLHKQKMAEDVGVKLIQIFENEWILKREIIKSRIKSMLGMNERVYARKCKIVEITPAQKRKFISDNHLQGDCSSSINIALVNGDDIMACMTFGKTRFDKSADYELLRFCSKLNMNIVGGFNKLLVHFRRMHPSASIVSYADRRFSRGDVYLKNGFSFLSESAPAYHYFKSSSIVVESRFKFQKHRLSAILDTYDEKLSEWENMKAAGYNRIWDCGTTKWVLK